MSLKSVSTTVALAFCAALVLGACAPKDKKLTDRRDGHEGGAASDVAELGGDLAFARAGFLPALEARRLLETALDAKSRVHLNGEKRDKLELGCRAIVKFPTSSPQLERFQISSRACEDASATVRGEKFGSESFLAIYPDKAPTTDSMAAAEGQPYPLPHTLVIHGDDLRFTLVPVANAKDRANVEAAYLLNARLFDENELTVVYELFGDFSVHRFDINLKSGVLRGDYSVKIQGLRFAVDKSSRKVQKLGGLDAKVEFSLGGESQKRTKDGFERARRFSTSLELLPAAELPLPAATCEAPSFELKVSKINKGAGKADRSGGSAGGVSPAAEVNEKKLSFTAGKATLGEAASPVELCRGEEPGFLYLFEGLFF